MDPIDMLAVPGSDSFDGAVSSGGVVTNDPFQNGSTIPDGFSFDQQAAPNTIDPFGTGGASNANPNWFFSDPTGSLGSVIGGIGQGVGGLLRGLGLANRGGALNSLGLTDAAGSLTMTGELVLLGVGFFALVALAK
jgi:hypothetical protein